MTAPEVDTKAPENDALEGAQDPPVESAANESGVSPADTLAQGGASMGVCSCLDFSSLKFTHG